MIRVGTLVTLDLPEDSPVLSLPWIITFGPLDDDEVWEPVVCGPYEREHALALAEAVVADEDLMAVVEPLQPAITVDQIRGEIAASRIAADEAEDGDIEDDHAGHDHDHDHDDEEVAAPSDPPSPEEIKAGFARIAARLAG
jgi:hypothetical protein